VSLLIICSIYSESLVSYFLFAVEIVHSSTLILFIFSYMTYFKHERANVSASSKDNVGLNDSCNIDWIPSSAAPIPLASY